jgi:signal transduction histidine kinase
MARSLRELRHGALTVAQYGLPQAVARLRDPQLVGQASPQQLAAQIAEPLPVRGNDEFGQVAEAFNAVHLEAVRTAAEQAALRASVATMFVNLARRSQILVDRLIGHLDRLERGEEDPDRLSELFQLDHLATRMRRNDENLLVLAGADSSRIQREPAPLTDVLRAAQSEVEHYTRIEFGTIDRDVEIAAHSVNDMVHLIAELLDNATAFSPPDSAVVVEARRVGDRAVLLVEDRGIGISLEQLGELNERLANPPMVDVAVSRMMGLVVVARLAARHGVKVELRPARERGTIADLTLPASVLVPRALAGRGGMPIAGSRDAAGVDRSATAFERPPLGPPLALESAPSAGAPSVPPREPANTGNAFPSMGAGPWGGATSGPGTGSGGPGGALNGFASGPFAGPPGPTNSRLFDDGGSSGTSLFGDGGSSGTSLFDGARPTSGAPSGGGDTAPTPATPTRGQPPAWSDLIGGNGTDDTGHPPIPPQDDNPLPQRQRGEPTPEDSAAADALAIPRQRPVETDSPAEDGARSWPEIPISTEASAPVDEVNRRPARLAPAMPPAWPPLPQATEPEAIAGAEPPQLPPVFSAALDMTAEMPRVRVDWEQNTEPAPPNAAGPNGGAGQRFADETMELPIFRELESAWFRPPAPAPQETAPTNEAAFRESVAVPTAVPDRNRSSAAPPVSGPVGAPETSDGSTAPSVQAQPAPSERPVPEEQASWHTAADEGWQAASALAEEQDFTTTTTGLPKRVPMSQLVPGGVEKGTVSAHKRTPEAVRGLLSAYHRGVQRGRSGKSGDAKTPEHTTAGPQSSQGGKEQEA